MPATLRGWAVALLLGGALRALGALDVVVHDLDLAQATLGQPVTVPVDIHGLDRQAFTAFQLEFGLDPAAYELRGVERGALIAAQDAGLAFPGHTPWLWALEARQEGAILRVAGLILMPGAQAQQGTLHTLNLARVPADHGELLRLNLVLRALTPTPIALVAAGTNLVVDDALDARLPAPRGTAGAMPGGTTLGGLPNAWQYRYFGAGGCRPDEDADGDRISNRNEYGRETNPVVPDVRLDLAPGWNLIALPIVPAASEPEAVLCTTHRLGSPDPAPGQPVFEGAVWAWDGSPPHGRLVRTAALQPLQGYWAYVAEPVQLVVPGAACSGTAVPLTSGWNLVGTPADIALDGLAGNSLRLAWSWDPSAGLVPTTTLRRGRGHWLFSPGAGTLRLDAVPP